jgi:hypothetical protein
MEQTYPNEPALANVNAYVPFVPMPGEWNDPSSATTVCGSSSRLVQVTVVPTGTVIVDGANAKLLMSTMFGPRGADSVCDAAKEGIDI